MYRTLLFSFLIFVAGCKLHKAGDKNMPPSRPTDFHVELEQSGGMLPDSKQFSLGMDSCTARYYAAGSESRMRFSVSAAEFDSIYTLLRDNRFTEIGTYEQRTYDRGGVSILIRWADKSYTILDGGSTYVNESDRPRFQAVNNGLLRLVDRKVNALKIPFTFIFDTSITNHDYEYSFTARQQFSFGTADLKSGPKTVLIFPGAVSPMINITRYEVQNGVRTPVQVAWGNPIITPPATGKRARISLKGTEIVVTTE